VATSASPPSMGRMMAVGIVTAAIVGAIAGFAAGYLTGPAPSGGYWSSNPAPQTRVFYIFTAVMGEPFDENAVGVPPDIFVPSLITVNRGDSVQIHFFNTENATQTTERHTFTMDAPYGSVTHDIGPGQNVTFTFTASTAGVHTYRCTYHPPSMVGWLTVLG